MFRAAHPEPYYSVHTALHFLVLPGFPGVFLLVVMGRDARARGKEGNELPLRSTAGRRELRLTARRPARFISRPAAGYSCILGAMKDFQLYQQILGLVEPWTVKNVTLKPKEQEVDVEVVCTETRWGCPQCGKRMPVHDWERRRGRHLDSCQFKTVISGDVPRVKCEEHGTQAVAVPWAEKYARFTRLFERFAIDVLQVCSASEACGLVRISWDEADGIKQRAVKRGLERKPVRVNKNLCVDEQSAARGQEYLTVVARVDEDGTTVDYVGEGRKQESLDAYWKQLTQEQLDGIDAVAMDMWEPYVLSTSAHVPEGAEKIVPDPFHMMKHMNEAVNEVRKAEHRALSAEGDDTLEGTRWLWLYGVGNIPEAQRPAFDVLKIRNLLTARAWALKETLRNLWLYKSEAWATKHFKRWHGWAIRSRLEPVKKIARMLKSRLANILTYCKSRLTNGPIEGLNNKIQGLIKKAYGYRNKQRFITDIYFHCGGLNLYPAQ
jgi:transposase